MKARIWHVQELLDKFQIAPRPGQVGDAQAAYGVKDADDLNNSRPLGG